MEKARDAFERFERIAKTTNKSSFMHLSENKPKLISEEGASFLGRNSGNVTDPFKQNADDAYLNDDTVPAEIFGLIARYREMINS
jgi:hypothetical protein